jgi:mannitol-1-phosphate/altronate dehydrogenase
VPGIDLNNYKHTLIERFSKQHIRDTLARLFAESSDRIPKWLLPVIRINLEAGGEILRSAAIVASWARYDEGTDQQHSVAGRGRCRRVLENQRLLGKEIARLPSLACWSQAPE